MPENRSYAEEGEPDLLTLYHDKPIYFLMGGHYTKVQVSFKTQVIKDSPVYFGYSQLMMWDLFIASPYFYDINYNPLAWYRVSLSAQKEEWLDLIPWEHESNGKGGLAERSWDRVAIGFHRRDSLSEKKEIYEEFKIWAPFHMNKNNPDLSQYRGLWELNLTLFRWMGEFSDYNDLALRLYPGGKSLTNPFHGGQEITIRLKNRSRNFLPLFVAQVFHGYGESLLDDQVDRWGVRVGFGF